LVVDSPICHARAELGEYERAIAPRLEVAAADAAAVVAIRLEIVLGVRRVFDPDGVVHGALGGDPQVRSGAVEGATLLPPGVLPLPEVAGFLEVGGLDRVDEAPPLLLVRAIELALRGTLRLELLLGLGRVDELDPAVVAGGHAPALQVQGHDVAPISAAPPLRDEGGAVAAPGDGLERGLEVVVSLLADDRGVPLLSRVGAMIDGGEEDLGLPDDGDEAVPLAGGGGGGGGRAGGVRHVRAFGVVSPSHFNPDLVGTNPLPIFQGC